MSSSVESKEDVENMSLSSHGSVIPAVNQGHPLCQRVV